MRLLASLLSCSHPRPGRVVYIRSVSDILTLEVPPVVAGVPADHDIPAVVGNLGSLNVNKFGLWTFPMPLIDFFERYIYVLYTARKMAF